MIDGDDWTTLNIAIPPIRLDVSSIGCAEVSRTQDKVISRFLKRQSGRCKKFFTVVTGDKYCYAAILLSLLEREGKSSSDTRDERPAEGKRIRASRPQVP